MPILTFVRDNIDLLDEKVQTDTEEPSIAISPTYFFNFNLFLWRNNARDIAQ